MAPRCSACVLGVCWLTLAFALAFALPLGVGPVCVVSGELATSTKDLNVGPFPHGVTPPAPGTSRWAIAANPSVVGATRAFAVAVTLVLSRSENSPPDVAQNRTDSGSSGASGSGCGVEREISVSIFVLMLTKVHYFLVSFYSKIVVYVKYQNQKTKIRLDSGWTHEISSPWLSTTPFSNTSRPPAPLSPAGSFQ